MSEKTFSQSLTEIFQAAGVMTIGLVVYPTPEEMISITETFGRFGAGLSVVSATAITALGVWGVVSAIKNIPNRQDQSPSV